MDDFSSIGDVPIIRDVLGQAPDMLSIEHVTVVANLHWEKMQSLLQIVCNQLQIQEQEVQNQSVRLTKAEDYGQHQDKRIAALEQELSACKTAMSELQQDREKKEKDAEQQKELLFGALKFLDEQQARTKQVEEWLSNLQGTVGNLQEGLKASNLMLKEINERVTSIEKEMKPLKELPPRMDALEGNMKKLNAATANLQQSFRAIDFGKLLKMQSMLGKLQPPLPPSPVPAPPTSEPAPPTSEPVQELEPPPPLPAIEPIVIIQPDLTKSFEVDETALEIEELKRRLSQQGEHSRDLEAQIDQLRLLLQQLSTANAADIDALRKQYKALRQEFDAKAMMTLPAVPEDKPIEIVERRVSTSGIEAAVAELQTRLTRKADEEAVDEVASDVQRLRDSLGQMESTINLLKRRTSLLASGGATIETMEARLRNAEDEVASLGSSKADRSSLDALELKLGLLSAAPKEPGAPITIGDDSAIQRLLEALSKKADRSDILDLRRMIQAQASRWSDEDIKRLFEGQEELRSAMADRKDVVTTIITQAPTTAPPSDEELRNMLNDHARRLQEHAELHVQLDAKLENKADQASLLFLKEMIEALKMRKSRGASIIQQPPSNDSLLNQLWAEVTATLNDHERVLQQLTQGVLIMSGHQEDEKIDTGIVSAFQPQLSVDDVMSEAPDTTSRPSTALTRSEPSPRPPSARSESSVAPADVNGPTSPAVKRSEPTVENSRPASRSHHVETQDDLRPSNTQIPVTQLHNDVDVPAPAQRTEPQENTQASTANSQGTPPGHTSNRSPSPRVAQLQEMRRNNPSPRNSNPSPRNSNPSPRNSNPPPREVEPIRVPESREPVREENLQSNRTQPVLETRTEVREPPVEAVPVQREVIQPVWEVPLSRQNTPPVVERENKPVESSIQAPSLQLNVDEVKHTAPVVVQGAQVETQLNEPLPSPDVIESVQTIPENRRGPEPRQNGNHTQNGNHSTPPDMGLRTPVFMDNTQNTRTPEPRPRIPVSTENRQYPRTPDTVPRSPDTVPRSPVVENRGHTTYTPAPDSYSYVRPTDFRQTDTRQAAPSTHSEPRENVTTQAAPRYTDDREYIQPSRSDFGEVASPASVQSVPATTTAKPTSSWRRNVKPALTGPFQRPQSPLEGTYNALEAALKEKKIRAKENVRTQDITNLRRGLEEMRGMVASLQIVKAEKQALEELWSFVRANITENAMFTGKPLLGFKCMSCEHSIEKLHPFRSDYLPTNIMPKQWLSMYTAERLFHNERREPPAQRSPSPPRSTTPFPKANSSNQEQQAGNTPAPTANQPSVKTTVNVQLVPKVASIPIRK